MGNRGTVDLPNNQDNKADVLRELTTALQDQFQKQEDHIKSIPTPIDFAKLERDVVHHGRLIYGIIIILAGSLLGGYQHFDNKLTSSINYQAEKINNNHEKLQDKLDTEIKSINHRFDSLLIQNNPKQAKENN